MRALVVLAIAVTCGVLAGVVIAGQGKSPPSVDEMQAAIETTPMTKLAEIVARDGLEPRGIFVQELATGYVCVWDLAHANSRSRQGGCNASDDVLGESSLSANLAYEGGPAIETVRDARISGLADDDVAAVAILMSDGSEYKVSLRKAMLSAGDFSAFGYRVRKSDLKRGIGPVAVVAYDARGAEIDRQTTGIG